MHLCKYLSILRRFQELLIQIFPVLFPKDFSNFLSFHLFCFILMILYQFCDLICYPLSFRFNNHFNFMIFHLKMNHLLFLHPFLFRNLHHQILVQPQFLKAFIQAALIFPKALLLINFFLLSLL